MPQEMQMIIVARCSRACQQYAFEHTLQDSEFAQDKISTHFTMLNVHNTVVLFFAVFVVLANANANGVDIRTGRSNWQTIVRVRKL